MSKSTQEGFPNSNVLAKYKIMKKIGEGLTAEVFLAKS
jgi:hypothetical protein